MKFFHALLKTLEEPPAHVIFIFATTENHKVPATILSRCQCYDFRRIALTEIAGNLGKVAAAEKIRISEAALSWIAEAGDGSMRDAHSIFAQVISYTVWTSLIRFHDSGAYRTGISCRLSEAVLQEKMPAPHHFSEAILRPGMKHVLLDAAQTFRICFSTDFTPASALPLILFRNILRHLQS